MGGSVFPRFAALRRIPSQAVLLKEHFSGALASKIEDYVDTISSLGHAPVFRSLNAPCEGVMIAQDFSGVQPFSLRRLRDRNGIIAQGDTAFEDGSEVSAFVAGKETGHVLEDYEFRVSSMGCFPHFFYDADSFKEQTASLAFMNPCLFAGHALILTGKAHRQNINGVCFVAVYIRYASEVLHVRKTAGGHGYRVRFHLRGKYGRDAAQHTGELKAAASGE